MEYLPSSSAFCHAISSVSGKYVFGRAMCAVPLRDFVRQAELIPEGRRHQFTHRPVVLVGVTRRRREYDIRPEGRRDALEDLLDLPVDGGQPAIGQVVQFHLKVAARREGVCCSACFLLALGCPGEKHVPDAQARVAAGQAEQRAARRDLDVDVDVVGVCPECQHGQWPGSRRAEPQRDHVRIAAPSRAARISAEVAAAARLERSGSQIIHGQSPRLYISSNWARSLTVSAGDQ
jgi:hypothetical protein